MIYFDCEESELLKIIPKEDIDFASSVTIPYLGGAGLWARKFFIDQKIFDAIECGKIKQIPREAVQPQRAPMAISDYVPNGAIKSMVDGKTYDSKSKYYKSVKEAGYHVIGNDNPVSKPATIESDISGRDVRNAIERLKSR